MAQSRSSGIDPPARIRDLVDERKDLLVVPSYSHDPTAVCSECEETVAFRLAPSRKDPLDPRILLKSKPRGSPLVQRKRRCATQVKVFIQNEAGSFVKHMHNEKTIEPRGSSKVSRPYPFPYGFIPHISADGGLNVDCYVLTSQPLKTGQIVECEPIALMDQIEDGQEDHNVLAVIPGEQRILDKQIESTLTEFVSHVFAHIPANAIEPGKFLNAQAALAHISTH